jgi:hypothetical protein
MHLDTFITLIPSHQQFRRHCQGEPSDEVATFPASSAQICRIEDESLSARSLTSHLIGATTTAHRRGIQGSLAATLPP